MNKQAHLSRKYEADDDDDGDDHYDGDDDDDNNDDAGDVFSSVAISFRSSRNRLSCSNDFCFRLPGADIKMHTRVFFSLETITASLVPASLLALSLQLCSVLCVILL